MIEDEPLMRDFVREVLEEDGFDVEVAEHGEAGIRTFRARPCDLVVTDLLMPEKEGIETSAELLQIDPHVRIIAISGAKHAATHFRVLKHIGVRAVLHKPPPAVPPQLRPLLADGKELGVVLQGEGVRLLNRDLPSRRPEPPAEPARVVLVDDEPGVLAALERMLDGEPFLLESFTDPNEALARIRTDPPAVVLADHYMPGMDGAELFKHVREFDDTVVRLTLTGRPDVTVILDAVTKGRRSGSFSSRGTTRSCARHFTTPSRTTGTFAPTSSANALCSIAC